MESAFSFTLGSLLLGVQIWQKKFGKLKRASIVNTLVTKLILRTKSFTLLNICQISRQNCCTSLLQCLECNMLEKPTCACAERILTLTLCN